MAHDRSKLTYAGIVGLSNDLLKFDSHCDGTNTGKCANWKLEWGLHNGRIQVDIVGQDPASQTRLSYEEASRVIRDAIRQIWSGDIVGYHHNFWRNQ